MSMRKIKTSTTVRLTATAAMCALLAGCSGGRLTTPYADTVSNTPEYIGVQSATVTCAGDVRLQGMALSGVVTAFLADFAVNLGSELLKDLQKNRSAIYAATGIVGNNCLPPKGGSTSPAELLVERTAVDSDGFPVGKPAFSLTGALELTSKKSADGKDQLQVSFKAEEFIYGRAAPTRGGSRKRVVLLVQISDKSPLGADEPGKDVNLSAPLRIDLGDVEEGYSYNSAMVGHVQSSVVIPYPDNTQPVVTAVVFETEDESVALRALTGAYDDNKDDLAKAIASLLRGGSDDK